MKNVWREANRERYYEHKKLNYAKGRKNTRNSGSNWTAEHSRMVMDHSITDRELSLIIGRSVQAIQIHRSRMKPE